ncbi:MAG: hypothetical protein ABEJ98_01270 [Candidatus Nanohaloarchaea archaeon]
MELEVMESPRRAAVVAAVSLWVVMYTLGFLHQAGGIYVLFGGEAPGSPLLHATNDWLFGLVPFAVTTALAEGVLRFRSR